MTNLTTTKYGFRIRSRTGMVVDNLAIHGRDESDAERKLRQMYPYCEVLERRTLNGHAVPTAESGTVSFEEVLTLVTR